MHAIKEFIADYGLFLSAAGIITLTAVLSVIAIIQAIYIKMIRKDLKNINRQVKEIRKRIADAGMPEE